MKKLVFDKRLRKPISDGDLRKLSIHAKKRFKERFGYTLIKKNIFLGINIIPRHIFIVNKL